MPLAAPHESSTDADGVMHVRTTVTLDAADDLEVERRFRAALEAGELTGPDGTLSPWRLVTA